MNRIQYAACLVLLIFTACGERKLPILGERYAEEKTVDGKTVIDTVYAVLPPFSFINQDSVLITNNTVKGKIFVADFFFISCPTICPIMKKEMLRVYNKYKGNPDVMMLSHTIDPEHDTLALLKDYSERLGSDGKQWMFLTGEREKIYEMAEKGYYTMALPDSTEPGGYIHSGGFILIDRQQRARGIYDGTQSKSVDQLMEDIEILLKEQ